MPPIPAVYAAATFLSTLAGGFFALRFSHWLDRIMAFSGGVLLAAGLLDLLPEAIALHSAARHGPLSAAGVYRPLLMTIVGFTLFYLVERMAILRSYHSHHPHPEVVIEHTDGPSEKEALSDLSRDAALNSHGKAHSHSHGSASGQVGILGAAGLCIHSILDGFSIGVAFHANAALGVLIAAAVIAHDFSDGITTVTLLLANQRSRKTSLFWLCLDALAPLLGVALATHLSLSNQHLADLLALFAGMFVYLGATHMLPEAHALSDSWVTVFWTLAGIVLMVGVTQWMG